MATTKKTNDYTNRKVDILAMDGKFSDMQFELNQILYGKDNSSGKVCAGIQKLAQRWVIEFLTPLGSIPYLTNRGTIFLNSIRSGKVRTELDATLLFNFAKDQAAYNLLQEDKDGTYPDDEKYSEVNLLGVQVITGEKLSISVKINSVAGSSRVVVVPVAVVPAR